MHIINVVKVTCSKFDCNILSNNKNQPIVCMTAIRYFGPIWLVPTYLQRTAIRGVCAKFHEETSKTKRLFNVAIDKRTEKWTKGQIHGRRDRRTDRRTGRQTNRHKDRHTYWMRDWRTIRQMDRQMERQIDGQIDRHTDSITDKRTNMTSSNLLEMVIQNIVYNIYFMGSEISAKVRCQLMTQINIPFPRE